MRRYSWIELRSQLALLRLAAIQLGGRRFWLLPLVPLAWPVFHMTVFAFGGRQEDFEPVAAQNTLIGFPLTVLAVFVGVRIIAGELEGRSIEIAYTVPGGCHRLWLVKLAAAMSIVLASLTLLALITYLFFTPYPFGALYGALQAATFYLVAAMGFATLFRSEVGGAMAAVALLALSFPFTAAGSLVSPFWNPAATASTGDAQIFAWILQNRIGVLLAILAIVALSFGRAERREKMLAG